MVVYLNILHLHIEKDNIFSYTVDCTKYSTKIHKSYMRFPPMPSANVRLKEFKIRWKLILFD